MSLRITSRSALGFRPQGTAGQTVLDSHRTLDYHLRRTLSSAHADLLAEPNVLGPGGMVDWYTPLDAPEGARPLAALTMEQSARLLRRLGGLLRDIRRHAGELRESPQQSERLLGQMLLLALEVPSEDCVFAVGEQPVLVFWGHLQDVPLPEAGILDRLVAAHAEPPAPPPAALPPVPPPLPAFTPPPIVVQIPPREAIRPPEPPPPPEAPPPPEPPVVEAVVEPPASFPAWWVPALWALFVVLCVAIAMALLRACGLGWPFAVDGLWLDYCPGRGTHAAELADLQAETARLQSELDRLLGAAAARQQQCGPAPTPAPAPAPPPSAAAPPPEPAPSQPQVRDILQQCRDNPNCVAMLEGCWSARHRLCPVRPDNTVDEGHCVGAQETWRFDSAGIGQSLIVKDTGGRCVTGVKVTRAPGGTVQIDRDPAMCSDRVSVTRSTYSCTIDSQGQTKCTSTEANKSQDWLDLSKGACPPEDAWR